VQAGIKAAHFQGKEPDKQNPVEHIEQSSDQTLCIVQSLLSLEQSNRGVDNL